MQMGKVVILGVFVADAAYRASRLPRLGETLLGSGFALGPGGKGSNQAVAAARMGAETVFITRLGADAFAEMAAQTWADAGVTPVVRTCPESHTGSAFIFLDEATGENAIIIAPGAAGTIAAEDLDAEAARISGASIFMTQLEQPLAAAVRGLEIARAAGVATLLNPAPAQPLPAEVIGLCDYLTPNETEAAALTGLSVEGLEGARAAANALRSKGAGTVILTLGERGALFHGEGISQIVPAVSAGAVVETTGAGDAFNGGFAAALAEGRPPLDAVRFGCAVAGLSVTRQGAAASMPSRAEVDALLRG